MSFLDKAKEKFEDLKDKAEGAIDKVKDKFDGRRRGCDCR